MLPFYTWVLVNWMSSPPDIINKNIKGLKIKRTAKIGRKMEKKDKKESD